MCIACEMALWIAMDDLPDGPPVGFPGYRAPGEKAPPDAAARFACDAPEQKPQSPAPPIADERKPIVTSRE
jgi:hypothetical protein